MKRQLLIFSLFIGLYSFVYSCKPNNKTNTINQEKNEQEMETKYQAIWEKALAGQDLKTIDILITQNRRFKLDDYDGWLDVYADTLSDPLKCAFYWSLSENIELGRNLYISKDNLDDTMSEIDFLEGKKDYIHKYVGLGEISKELKDKKNKEKRDSLLNDLKIERDRLQKQIAEYKIEGQSNLSLIQYCLDKGMKLNWNAAVSLTGGNDNDWPVNEISIFFYFDSIAKNKGYFKEGENDLPDLTSSFVGYITYPYLDLSMLKKMYSKGINKKVFFETVYNPYAEGPDVAIVDYQAEKMLFDWMPDEMFHYSGHTLLHAAIINLDLPTVQTIIRNNKDELYIKTVPKPHFTSREIYGGKSFTPLELALYQQKEIEKSKEIEKNLKESPDYPDYLPNILCAEQIKEIIAFLRQESGITTDNDTTSSVPPARPKRYWSALADDD